MKVFGHVNIFKFIFSSLAIMINCKYLHQMELDRAFHFFNAVVVIVTVPVHPKFITEFGWERK
jgi:hypothetical protein